MSMALNLFFLIASLEKPVAVELSKRSRVGGQTCLRLTWVVQIVMASWPLIKLAPISASAGEAIALERISERVKMGPLMVDSPEGG